MSINFCHITPTPHLSLTGSQSHHLLLAHLIEDDGIYRDFYKTLKSTHPANTLIVDNSAFEKFKRGLPMYTSSKLIDMGIAVSADYIVMSDYPNQHSQVTISAAGKLAPQFKEAGFGTFFVPQSIVGDLPDLIAAYRWAASHPELVDYIGVSILGVPNGYGVERGNKLQRYMARYHFMETLEELGILGDIAKNGQKIHFLGMVDGPNEISLVSRYHSHITTWDSSAACWLGLHANRSFDVSPTGLIDGEYETEVDFDFCCVNHGVQLAQANMAYIDRLCSGESPRTAHQVF